MNIKKEKPWRSKNVQCSYFELLQHQAYADPRLNTIGHGLTNADQSASMDHLIGRKSRRCRKDIASGDAEDLLVKRSLVALL
jgi:hypothetical protein